MVIAREVMIDAAALLGDAGQSTYTNEKLLPYLQQATDDLQERLLAVSAASKINARSDLITLPAGTTEFGEQLLPNDILEPISVYVKDVGGAASFIEVEPERWERGSSRSVTTSPVDRLYFWTWRRNDIHFNECTRDQIVFVRYRQRLTRPIGENSIIDFPRTRLFLYHKTAALYSEFKGENPTRADKLTSLAEYHWDRFRGIETKFQQKTPARRRPFNRFRTR